VNDLLAHSRILACTIIRGKARVLDVRCSPALTHVAQSGQTVDYPRGVERIEPKSKNAEPVQSWARHVRIVSVGNTAYGQWKDIQ
jgi:hypothetical protein